MYPYIASFKYIFGNDFGQSAKCRDVKAKKMLHATYRMMTTPDFSVQPELLEQACRAPTSFNLALRAYVRTVDATVSLLS